MNSNMRVAAILLAVAIIGAGTVGSLYVLSLGHVSNSSTSLPPGCTKPANGFLLIASNQGWNDSAAHGVNIATPGIVWPKITVTQGQTVSITVCNTDVQAHSFQIAHYEQGSANTLSPQQVRTFQFVADQAGTFQVYCEIECSIHYLMQSGQLVVMAS